MFRQVFRDRYNSSSIEDITLRREDMNFISSGKNNILRRSAANE